MMKDDTDFDEINEDESDDGSSIEIEPITMSPRSNRPRRSWRDVERMREQREMEKLIANDNWFESD